MQKLEVLGFEPRASCMQSRRSTTELHPLDRIQKAQCRDDLCTSGTDKRQKKSAKNGGAGVRTQGLLHAKQALYH